VLPLTFDQLLDAQANETLRLDPPPAYATSIHVAYYLEQRNGLIPAFAGLPGLTVHQVCFVVTEGSGQLQQMKHHLAKRCGLGTPATVEMLQATFDHARPRIPHAPIITIPNTSWQVDMTKPPAQLVRDHFLFLLEHNWGQRPLTANDLAEAGRWIQAHAQPSGSDVGGGWHLNGPDALLVAGSWLATHPGDLQVLTARSTRWVLEPNH